MPEVEPVCDENRTVQPCAGPAGGEWSKGGWIGCFQRTPKSQIKLTQS
jgi:hypothetical protein